MPTYEYKCADCGKQYDIFHKVREVADDVLCPSCGSMKHTRLMSMTSMAMAGESASSFADTSSSCETGSCCGGSCGIN